MAQIRQYRVTFWREIADECVDHEITLQAENIESAIRIAKNTVKVYKRLTKIEEV